MRTLVLIIMAGLLSIALLATAQEDTASDDASESADPGTFVPSEEVAADTAVVFPTDI